MSHLDKLDDATIGEVVKELWLSSTHIFAIGELVKNQRNDVCYENETMYGLGSLLCEIAERVNMAKERLEYGENGGRKDLDNISATDDESGSAIMYGK